MPVKRYRSIEEMPGPPALSPLDPENLRAALSLAEVAYRMFPWRFGVLSSDPMPTQAALVTMVS